MEEEAVGGGAGAGQIAPSGGAGTQRPTFCISLAGPAPSSQLSSLRAAPWASCLVHRDDSDSRGGDGKNGVLASSRSYFFASVECLALYFNRTHNTQNLLLKKQRTRDICTANAKTTHNPRHAAIARPCDIRNKKRLPGIPTTCFCHPPSCPGFLLPCPGCSQLLLTC